MIQNVGRASIQALKFKNFSQPILRLMKTLKEKSIYDKELTQVTWFEISQSRELSSFVAKQISVLILYCSTLHENSHTEYYLLTRAYTSRFANIMFLLTIIFVFSFIFENFSGEKKSSF